MEKPLKISISLREFETFKNKWVAFPEIQNIPRATVNSKKGVR
jgi:hypothetical protein